MCNCCLKAQEKGEITRSLFTDKVACLRLCGALRRNLRAGSMRESPDGV